MFLVLGRCFSSEKKDTSQKSTWLENAHAKQGMTVIVGAHERVLLPRTDITPIFSIFRY